MFYIQDGFVNKTAFPILIVYLKVKGGHVNK